MHFAVQSGVMAETRLLLGRGESGLLHLFGILPEVRYLCLSPS